jgi:predicted MFS family arabinose efflux permease
MSAMFQSSFYSGLLCGIATGSIIFEQTNFSVTFIISSLFSFGSIILLYFFLNEKKKEEKIKIKTKVPKKSNLYSNFELVILIIFSAIPAKISLTGFYYFLTPLLLSDLGNSPSDIGRIMMVYGLIQIVLSPIMAKFAKTSKIKLIFIKSGAFLTSAVFIALYFYRNTSMVLISMILLGIAHSMSVSSQLSLLFDITKKESKQLGFAVVVAFFRKNEIIGHISGPLLVGLFISLIGLQDAVIGLGLYISLSFLIFSIVFRFKEEV